MSKYCVLPLMKGTITEWTLECLCVGLQTPHHAAVSIGSVLKGWPERSQGGHEETIW